MPVRTRRDYFEAGLAILAERGASSLTISRLCTSLGVSKGSFYHHFVGMPAYTQSLLEFWEHVHLQRFAALQPMAADAHRRLEMLIAIGAELPHAEESALRSLARTDAAVATVLDRIDAAREQAIADAYEQVGLARLNAVLFARMSMAILVGTQARDVPVDREALRRMFAHTMSAALGTLAQATS